MKHRIFKFIYLTLLVIPLFTGCNARTSLVLSPIFSDNMVLQQKTKVCIWGSADPGKIVELSATWSKQTYKVKVDPSGDWKIYLTTPKFGGPYKINVSEGGTITFQNVMIGEVWLCSGQSNMEMPLGDWGMVNNYKSEISKADYPNIRLFTVQHQTSNQLQKNIKLPNGEWQVCAPGSISNFSALAYFYARQIYKKTGIPIGVIQCSWPGTIAEGWVSGTALKQLPDYVKATEKIEKTDEKTAAAVFNKQFQLWQRNIMQKDSGYKGSYPRWADVKTDDSSWPTMKIPSYMETQGIEGFDGAMWFRKKVSIPEAWKGKELQVNLGTIDDEDITYFDGKKIGESKGSGNIRNYIIPGSLVTGGEHVLTVRVLDNGGMGGICGDKNILTIATNDSRKIVLNGDWKYKPGINLKDIPPAPTFTEGPNNPTVIYNAMVNPLLQYTIRGVIWYQGENNVYNAFQYRTLFPALITDWRKKRKIGDFPFYFVQLANYQAQEQSPVESAWAELREAQLQTLSLPNTGMAVTIDIGSTEDIHPKNKQEVGRRLGLIALAKTYGYPLVYSGPTFKSYEVHGHEMSITFENAGGGLKTKDGSKVSGFAIAGPDHQFYWAEGKIHGNVVTVTSPDVSAPVAARYGWANNPTCNLYNDQLLPASPFRTDDWQGITAKNK